MVRVFALLYTDGAWAYDAVSWLVSAGQWWRWAGLAGRYLGPDPVVEVGCGPGWLLRRLRRRGRVAFGLDRSPQMVSRASRRAGTGRVVRADVYALPCRDTSVGTLVLTFPPPFVFDPAAIAAMARALRPGGRIVVVEGALPPATAAGRLAAATLALSSGGGSSGAVAAALQAAGLVARRLRLRGDFGTVWLTLAERGVDAGPDGA